MNHLKLLLVVIFVFFGLVEGKRRKKPEVQDKEIPDEARLYQYLTDKYDRINPDRAIIPVANVSETQLVNLGVALISFLDFDEDSGFATFNFWERYLWKDAFLSWNPDDFGGIGQIRLPNSQIWKPDIVLYNSVDPEPKTADVLCVVSSDGTVLYIPPTQQKVICSENNGNVNCSLKYGSWTYDGYRLDVDFYDGLAEVDINDYIQHNKYNLLDHSAKKNVKYYPCCAEPYPDLTFTLKFEKIASWWEGKK